jgi:hypothetical protein
LRFTKSLHFTFPSFLVFMICFSINDGWVLHEESSKASSSPRIHNRYAGYTVVSLHESDFRHQSCPVRPTLPSALHWSNRVFRPNDSEWTSSMPAVDKCCVFVATGTKCPTTQLHST